MIGLACFAFKKNKITPKIECVYGGHVINTKTSKLGTKGIPVSEEGMCVGQEPNPYPCDKVGVNP